MATRPERRAACRQLIAACVAGWLAASVPAGPAAARDPDYVSARPAAETGLQAVDHRNQVQALYTQSHALLIGQSRYAHWRPLDAVRREIDGLREALEENNFRVEVYNDLGADDLVRVVDAFVRTRGAVPGARLFFYFGGHGWTRDVGSDAMGFIIPVDAPEPSQDRQRFLEMALPMTLFEAYARVPDARHMMFVFDSCFSGSFFSRRGATPDLARESQGRENPAEGRPASVVFSERTTLQRARQFLTAGTATQTVPGKSILVDLLTQVLRGQRPEADVNRDGFVTGDELQRYLLNAVVEVTRDADRLNPQFGYLRDQNYSLGDFVFQLPTGDRAAPAPAAAATAAPLTEYRPRPAEAARPPPRQEPQAIAIPVTSVPPLAVGQARAATSAQQARLAAIIERLTSPDERVRRPARVDLARFLTELGPDASAGVSANLVRGLVNSSYRYQLGVATALGSLQQGWTSIEPTVTAQLLDSAMRSVAGRDPTLRQNLERARRGLRS
ncbi:MAG TPA: caspase family protein [Roseomonas sp.]|jgi:hypothetical protein